MCSFNLKPLSITLEPEKFRVFSWRTLKLLSLVSAVSTAAFVGLCMALTEQQFRHRLLAMPILIGLAALGAYRESSHPLLSCQISYSLSFAYSGRSPHG